MYGILFLYLWDHLATVQTTVSRLSRNGGEHQPRLFKTVPKRDVISITKGCGGVKRSLIRPSQMAKPKSDKDTVKTEVTYR